MPSSRGICIFLKVGLGNITDRTGYALIPLSTNPALNSRTVTANPFGDSPVWCWTEIFHATLQKWVTTPWVYQTGNQSQGILSSWSAGEGIVTRCGNNGYIAPTVASGASQEVSSTYTTASPTRIHVIKVTS